MNRLNTFLRPLLSAILLIMLWSVVEAQRQSSTQNSLSNPVVILFPPTGEQHHLRAGDLLSLRVFKHPEFSSDNLRVDERGMISLPLVGEVEVTGRTIDGLRSEIVSRYRKYEKPPSVPTPSRDSVCESIC